jgi:hypothetical protein
LVTGGVTGRAHGTALAPIHRGTSPADRQLGATVTLTGSVGTWLQREVAERAAANAPGVAHVEDRITIESVHDSKMDDWDEIC